jgi:hypothetical protein
MDYNAYRIRYLPDTRRLTEGLFLAGSILWVAQLTIGLFVTQLGALAGLGSIVIDALVINEICNGINRLAQA